MPSQVPYRIGQGFDSHRLEPGGPLRIGGIDVEFDRHLVGYSDADVVLHALTDALLGSIAAGDIGEMFPVGKAENRQRDSADFVRAALEQVHYAGYRIANLDCTIVAERPKLGTYKQSMVQRIASLLDVEPSAVNVKAKTAEGVGPVGLGQSIEAHCIVLVTRLVDNGSG